MKLLHYLSRNFSKPGITLHSSHQQRCWYATFSKPLQNKSKQQGHTEPSNWYIHSKFWVPKTTGTSILGSFVQRSYCSTSSNNKKMGLLSWYLSMLESWPILTKSLSSSIIYAAADVTSQMITLPASGSLDFIRTSRMAAYGLLILGPMQHVWFNFVARVLPKRDIVTTLKKIVMGQLVFGPFITSLFFAFNAALQGESAVEIAGRLRRDLLPTLRNGLIFWPLCDFFTYKIIPVHVQPLVNSSFAYLWTIYLTYMASLGKASSN